MQSTSKPPILCVCLEDAQLKVDDNLSEKDLDEFGKIDSNFIKSDKDCVLEKKRIWAENFLRTYYKMKDMLLKKREIEEKEMKELKEKKKMADLKDLQKVQKKIKEENVKDETQDMKAMILNMLNFDWILPRLQK